MSTNTEAVKSNLGEAGGHLKQAAVHAGEAIKGAAGAAGASGRRVHAATRRTSAAATTRAATAAAFGVAFAAGWIISKLGRSDK